MFGFELVSGSNLTRYQCEHPIKEGPIFEEMKKAGSSLKMKSLSADWELEKLRYSQLPQ